MRPVLADPAQDARLGRQVATGLGAPLLPGTDWAAYGAACREAMFRRTTLPMPPLGAQEPRALSTGAARSPSPSRLASTLESPTVPRRRASAQGGAAARAVLAGAPHPAARHIVRRALFGASWRVLLILAAIVAAAAALPIPPLGVVVVVGLGLVLGLWHRGWGVARVWRWTLLAAAVGYIGPVLGPSYGEVLAGSLGLGAVAPWGAAWRAAR